MRLLLKKLYLGLFCLVIAFGNTSRIIPAKFLFGSLNLGELLIYTVGTLALPFYLGRLLRTPLYVCSVMITLFSLGIGLVKWGVDFTSILYPIRLVLQISAAGIAGTITFELLRQDVRKLATQTCRIYFYISIVSILILIAFPDSTVLWATLGESGVDFQGDPHSGRLVSTYFDPNFFGALIAFPITLAWTLYFRQKSLRIFMYASVMVIADLLTFSRSGLFLLFVMSLSLMVNSILKSNIGAKLLKYTLFAIAGTLPLSLSVLLLPEYFDRIIGRFTDIGGDDSAHARLRSFLTGVDLIEKEPILGYGYNYGLPASLSVRAIGLDSSIEVLVLNFGLILTAVAFIAGSLWMRNTNLYAKYRASADLLAVWKVLFAYLILSIVWTSTFNQLLFYTWWLMPIMAWMFYLDNLRRSPSGDVHRTIRAEESLEQSSAKLTMEAG